MRLSRALAEVLRFWALALRGRYRGILICNNMFDIDFAGAAEGGAGVGAVYEPANPRHAVLPAQSASSLLRNTCGVSCDESSF